MIDNKPLPSFVNSKNQITRWPKKEKDKQACLALLAKRFTIDVVYNEQEVNTLILLNTVNVDHALLRRELCIKGLLARTADGAKYWRVKCSTTNV